VRPRQTIFIGLFKDAFSIETLERRMNVGLGMIWNETVVAYPRCYHGGFLEELSKSTKTLSK
jgi:hypothetical protein